MTFTVIYYINDQMGPMKSDHIMQLITLTVIILSNFYCTIKEKHNM
jgi:hypothetical protein